MENLNESKNNRSHKTDTSRRLRFALTIIMKDGEPRTTAMMQNDLVSQNMVLGNDFNTNHLWGAIGVLKNNGIIKQVGRGQYQLSRMVNDAASADSDKLSLPAFSSPSLSQLQQTLRDDLNTAIIHMTKELDQIKVSDLSLSDIQLLYELTKVKENLTTILSGMKLS